VQVARLLHALDRLASRMMFRLLLCVTAQQSERCVAVSSSCVQVARLLHALDLASRMMFRLLLCVTAQQCKRCVAVSSSCVQVARLLHALDRLASRKMFRLFRKAPNPTDVYDSSEGRHAYNRVIPLPLGLDDIQVRASGSCVC
jgi:hypothetical protein